MHNNEARVLKKERSGGIEVPTTLFEKRSSEGGEAQRGGNKSRSHNHIRISDLRRFNKFSERRVDSASPGATR